ncbi:putative glutathione-specific gamma-glutamylcyclotransferase 2 [Glandiceps talaboti]
MWIYGYGSLIWNPGFEYEEKSIGYVKGYARKFCVISTVNRGTPEKPGRVAALVEEPEGITWGVAYRIKDGDAKEILETLGPREAVTDLFTITFHPRDGKRSPFDVKAFWVLKRTEDVVSSDRYCVDEDITTTAELIVTSVGPKGLKNIDYFVQLSKFLKSINVDDPHMSELECHIIKSYKL